MTKFRPAPGVVDGPYRAARLASRLWRRRFWLIGLLLKWGSAAAWLGLVLGYLWSKWLAL
mgnify:CR=1 FL=1